MFSHGVFFIYFRSVNIRSLRDQHKLGLLIIYHNHWSCNPSFTISRVFFFEGFLLLLIFFKINFFLRNALNWNISLRRCIEHENILFCLESTIALIYIRDFLKLIVLFLFSFFIRSLIFSLSVPNRRVLHHVLLFNFNVNWELLPKVTVIFKKSLRRSRHSQRRRTIYARIWK